MKLGTEGFDQQTRNEEEFIPVTIANGQAVAEHPRLEQGNIAATFLERQKALDADRARAVQFCLDQLDELTKTYNTKKFELQDQLAQLGYVDPTAGAPKAKRQRRVKASPDDVIAAPAEAPKPKATSTQKDGRNIPDSERTCKLCEPVHGAELAKGHTKRSAHRWTVGYEDKAYTKVMLQKLAKGTKPRDLAR